MASLQNYGGGLLLFYRLIAYEAQTSLAEQHPDPSLVASSDQQGATPKLTSSHKKTETTSVASADILKLQYFTL